MEPRLDLGALRRESGFMSGEGQRDWSRVVTVLGTEGDPALVIQVGGRRELEFGPVSEPRGVRSIRKAFVSALAGIQAELGLVDPSASLADLGIDDLQGLSSQERSATVLDLLRCRSGVYHPTDGESPWMELGKPARGAHAPGERFVYNNWDVNVLGAILEGASGRDLFLELRERIVEPLGLRDFRYAQEPDGPRDGVHWPPGRSRHPMYALRMSARDLATFGELYLRGGKCGETQVIPAAWVEASVRPHSDAGDSGSYGYLWWVERRGHLFPGGSLPRGSFAAQGYGGQLLLVIPEHQVVLVHTREGDWDRAQSVTHLGQLLARVIESLRA